MAQRITDQATVDKVRELVLAGFTGPQIEADTGVKQATVRVWRSRYGWNVKAKPDSKASGGAVDSVKRGDLSDASATARVKLSDELQRQLVALETTPIKGARELSGRNGRAATVKTVTETAASIYGWKAEQPTTVNLAVLLAVDPDKLARVAPDAETADARSSQPIDV